MSQGLSEKQPVVLVAALDWGLGHATRCIPIIKKMQEYPVTLRLAGSGASGHLLRSAFPDLPYSEIPARSIRYARSAGGLLWKLLLQLPRFRRNVEAEKQWLRQQLETGEIHLILSDNRYGLYHPRVHSVFLTHQLEIQTPFGRSGNRLLRRLHYRLIERFTECWVPDGPAPGFGGALSHPDVLPRAPLRYIGPLSRFQHAPNPSPAVDLAIVLSGPEPQRSIWEQQLLAQLSSFSGRVLLVRGLPEGGRPLQVPAHVALADHLPAAALQEAMASARLVVARCGYSTVMDLAALRQKSILVPTPGQTEQEYLARHLHQAGFACCLSQKDFKLRNALSRAGRFSYLFPEPPGEEPLREAVEAVIGGCLRREP